MRAHFEAEFAGEMWRFELKPMPYRWDEKFGTLAEMTIQCRQGVIGAAAARHVLIAGLCSGEMTRRIWAEPLVDAEIMGKPLAEYVPLVMSILVAAFAGNTDEADAAEQG